MKNRKTIIVAFVLVACMIVGVGYAALSDTFKIDGNATVSEANATDYLNENVYFKGIVVAPDNVVSDVTDIATYGYTASCNVAQDSASYHIYNLKGDNSATSVTFRIQNDSDLAVTLNFESTDFVNTKNLTDKDYFDVTYSYNNGVNDVPLTTGVTVAAGEHIDIKVTVTLNYTPVEELTGEFDFTFIAKSPDPAP